MRVVEISQIRREKERFGPVWRFSLFFALFGKHGSGAGGGGGGWTDLCARRFGVSLPFPLLGRRLLPLLRESLLQTRIRNHMLGRYGRAQNG